MGLPSEAHIKDARLRLWDRAYIERTGLYLMGIALSLHAGAAADEVNRDRLERKASELEADFPAMAELLESEWTHVPGTSLPDRVVFLLCCHDEAALAGALSLPIRFIYAGADRMGELSRRLIDAGLVGVLPSENSKVL